MLLDFLTMGAAVVSFGFFLSIHWIASRRVQPEGLLRSLTLSAQAAAAGPVVLWAGFFIFHLMPAPWPARVCAIALSLGVYGLLCFVYVLCIFGPYETSVRMRLVREIAAAPEGLSEPELLQRYNPAAIADLRLRRLTGSGDLRQEHGKYLPGSKANVFFLLDQVAWVLKKWIGR